ncbi:MAG: hypothetical protein VB082_05645 [Christensenella sp.]|nr:hypothetical protein [Christensenella sp.]
MNLKSEKFSNVLEIVIVVFLGIASVFSAFAAYQSSLNSSAMSKYYNEGIATITDANSSYVEAGQVISNDMTLYQNLLSLSLEIDYAETPEEAEKAQEKFDNYSAKFLSQDLLDAITWAESKEGETDFYTSPFESEDYMNSVYAEANETYESGRQMLEEGHVYNTNGDKMGLIVIYFATVMFLLGICNALKRNELKIALAAFAAVIFVIATVQMFGIPFLKP